MRDEAHGHFLQHAVSNGPTLLLLDSHSSYGESSDIGQSTQSGNSSGTGDYDRDASDKKDPVDDECPSESGVMESGCGAADILYSEETFEPG